MQREQCYLSFAGSRLGSFYFFDEFPVFSCCKWTYFFFFFFFKKVPLEPKFLFLVVGKLLADQLTWRKTVVWSSAWICFIVVLFWVFFFPSPLSLISLLVWQVQKPGPGLNSAKQILDVYLIVKCVPFSLLAAPMLSLNPQELFIIFSVHVRLVRGNVMTV